MGNCSLKYVTKPGQVDLATWNRHCSSCVPTTSVTAAILAASLRPLNQILTVPESHFTGLKPHKAKNVSPGGILVFLGPAPTFSDAFASKLLCIISFNSFRAGLFLAFARLRRTFVYFGDKQLPIQLPEFQAARPRASCFIPHYMFVRNEGHAIWKIHCMVSLPLCSYCYIAT